jgi:hypothetical protein
MEQQVDRYHRAAVYAADRPSVQSSRFPSLSFSLFPSHPLFTARMKAFFATLLLAIVCCAFAGCETDMPPEPTGEHAIQRGLRGKGKLVPVDNSSDPLINETSGAAQ